jgi:hypothetical protein
MDALCVANTRSPNQINDFVCEHGDVKRAVNEGTCPSLKPQLTFTISRMDRKLDSCLATPIERRWRNTPIPSPGRSCPGPEYIHFRSSRSIGGAPTLVVRVCFSALAAKLVLQSQSADMSRGLHGSGSVSVIAVQHAA